ncbi:DUF6513 domain-containing protein [Pirellulaceae bacterium SH501]
MNETTSIHFVTGKLAEPALREIVQHLASKHRFDYTIDVLPITVAALMTPKWLLRHMRIPNRCDRVILPGYLQSGIDDIRNAIDRDVPIDCGPKDVRDLPLLFGSQRFRGEDYGSYSVEIIAEINYAPRLSLSELISQSKQLIDEGANRIDLGCEPGRRWNDIAFAVKELRSIGVELSVDSFDAWEVEQATRAGASLVLSVNETNVHQALDWGAEVVVIPELGPQYLASLSRVVDILVGKNVSFRLDPILEPIGCGFSQAVGRYLETRREFPDAAMMMGIGNVTELTDADSAPINMLLLGICEELQIRSVLTTQVISWAKTSVRECDIARRLANYAVRHRVPPKHLDDRLVMLRDPRATPYSKESIVQLANSLKDNNYRILLSDSEIHLLSAGVHLHGTDPYQIMEELMQLPESRNVDVSHSFYLGFELAKAATALALGKRYEQDEPLRWGLLSRNESHHRLKRAKRSAQEPREDS